MSRHNRFRPYPSLRTSGVGGNQRKHLRRGPACERHIAPSMRFIIPRATSSAGVRSTRAYHTRHLPSLGFLNPSTACASADLPVLFHTGATCGIQRTRTIARFASRKRCRGRHRRITPNESATSHGPEHVVCEAHCPEGDRHEAASTDPKTRPARPEPGLSPRSRQRHDPKATLRANTRRSPTGSKTPGTRKRDPHTNP